MKKFFSLRIKYIHSLLTAIFNDFTVIGLVVMFPLMVFLWITMFFVSLFIKMDYD